MKNLIFTFCFSLLFSLLSIVASLEDASAHPGFYRHRHHGPSYKHYHGGLRLRPSVTFTQFQARSYVYNYYHRPVVCNVTVEGFTYYGQPLFSTLRRVVLWPGQGATAFVNAFPGNPFVNARGFSNCFWY